MVEEQKRKYQDFLDDMIMEVKNELGDEYTIQINTVLKNNNVSLDGLIIRKGEVKITPNIYLHDFYQRYLKGEEWKSLVQEVIQIYLDKTKEQSNFDINFTYEQMKDSIIYRLVNYERNQELLKTIPHIRFLNLAVTFHCLVKSDEDGIGTIRITKEHLKQWQVNEEEIVSQAFHNTQIHFQPVIRTMKEILQEFIEFPVVVDEIEPSQNMYVLTNSLGINGASCLLYDSVLSNFSKHLQSDFYILPSSIHEILLIPEDDSINHEQLKQMVMEVNQTQVPEDEILSDSVYYFSREEDKIEMIMI